MRSVVRLGHSLSDAHSFGPLNLEPVYGYHITRVSDCILHHVSSHHMTLLLRSPCVSRGISSVQKLDDRQIRHPIWVRLKHLLCDFLGGVLGLLPVGFLM